MYALIYGLMGFGASQESGAFHAWFDNNYRVAMPQDKDRKAYGVFWGKVGFIWQISSTLVLIPGSIIATIFFRELVFQIQAKLFHKIDISSEITTILRTNFDIP